MMTTPQLITKIAVMVFGTVPEKTLGFLADMSYLDVDNDTRLCEHFEAVDQ